LTSQAATEILEDPNLEGPQATSGSQHPTIMRGSKSTMSKVECGHAVIYSHPVKTGALSCILVNGPANTETWNPMTARAYVVLCHKCTQMLISGLDIMDLGDKTDPQSVARGLNVYAIAEQAANNTDVFDLESLRLGTHMFTMPAASCDSYLWEDVVLRLQPGIDRMAASAESESSNVG